MGVPAEKTQTILSILALESCMFDAVKFVVNSNEFAFDNILEIIDKGPLSIIFKHLLPDRQRQVVSMRMVLETRKTIATIQKKLDLIDYMEIQHYSNDLKEKKNEAIIQLAKKIDDEDSAFQKVQIKMNKDHQQFEKNLVELVNLNQNFLSSYFKEVKHTHDEIMQSFGLDFEETTENASTMELVKMSDLDEFELYYKLDLTEIHDQLNSIEDPLIQFASKQIMLQFCYNDQAHQRFGSESLLEKKAGMISGALTKTLNIVVPACKKMMKRLSKKHLKIIQYTETPLFSTKKLEKILNDLHSYLKKIDSFPMKKLLEAANEVTISVPEKKAVFKFKEKVLQTLKRYKAIN